MKNEDVIELNRKRNKKIRGKPITDRVEKNIRERIKKDDDCSLPWRDIPEFLRINNDKVSSHSNIESQKDMDCFLKEWSCKI